MDKDTLVEGYDPMNPGKDARLMLSESATSHEQVLVSDNLEEEPGKKAGHLYQTERKVALPQQYVKQM